MDRVAIKDRAKTLLGNNIFGNVWLLYVLIFLIESALTVAIGNIVPGIGVLLIIGPITYGVDYSILKNIRGWGKVEITDIFKGFKDDLGQALLLGLLSSIFIFLWSLLLVIPGIVKAYAYSMAYYIKVDHPEYGWKECLDESIRITNGHKFDLFVLDLSFIGWLIIGGLCLGIGTLWVAPYMQTSRALYYEELRDLI